MARVGKFPLRRWIRSWASVLIISLYLMIQLLFSLGIEDTSRSPTLLYHVHNPYEAAAGQGISSSGKKSPQKADEDSPDASFLRNYLLKTTGMTTLPITAFIEYNSDHAFLNMSQSLPLRLRKKQQITKVTYQTRNLTCADLASTLPVGHAVDMDDQFGPNAGVFHESLFSARHAYAKCCCPVDADPWLPWLHDVFVVERSDSSKSFVTFVAQNRRRCRTSPSKSVDDLLNLEPQVSLLQSVPVKRITEERVREIAPSELWGNDYAPLDYNGRPMPRYTLASFRTASPDARETRFICRFHRLKKARNSSHEYVTTEVLGETLSTYDYNYEHAHFMKPVSAPMLTRPGDGSGSKTMHNDHVWNSNLYFRCPLPLVVEDALPRSVVDDIPSLYVDLVPIRTRARDSKEGYFHQYSGAPEFDPYVEWGKNYVLPTVEASGRWANLPLCIARVPRPKPQSGKRFKLAGCLWASSLFLTRGASSYDWSTKERLLEWLTYHLFIAKVDHIFVYDNSGAYSHNESLADIVNLFPPERATLIKWPHRTCNNNRPMHENPGERSSQYAAEASCRLRYGPHTDWMVFFDTDEYLIPQKNWTDLQDWLVNGIENNPKEVETKILSFYQTRAKPNIEFMSPYHNEDSDKCQRSSADATPCLNKLDNVTYLQTYDCESTPLPKPKFGWRAQKQIYRPDFVLNHFVHYSTVTRRLIEKPNEVLPGFVQKKPYERRVNELTEAFMLHAKTTPPEATYGWKKTCSKTGIAENKCPVGFSAMPQNGTTSVGNCHRHERVSEIVRRLEGLLHKFR